MANQSPLPGFDSTAPAFNDDDLSSNPFADMQSSTVAFSATEPFQDESDDHQLPQASSPPTPSTAFPTPAHEKRYPVDDLTPAMSESIVMYDDVPVVGHFDSESTAATASVATHEPHPSAPDLSVLLGDPRQFSTTRTEDVHNKNSVLPISPLGRKPVGGALASAIGLRATLMTIGMLGVVLAAAAIAWSPVRRHRALPSVGGD